MLSGCTPAQTLTTPTIIYVGCPKVTSCPIPGSSPETNGDLSADNRQLESSLVSCALQVETIKQCQEQHHAETKQLTPRPE
ncbi:Rz1-like lysis system protein LysC [Brenneria populi]|uniref:Rz1-like lysis system protein LysC n=1 Tax=Brenneria populi TaxID=1505588 RepID=A0ABU6JWY9_9GAMM|nr:Rz1-like lysis system protein LysC [Brenneria populi Li et al. 2015]MEC5345080.1 Rz1-like lysis system protein LysC [Brenneria populi Li et al. 2015]